MAAPRHWASAALGGRREGCAVEREQTAGRLGLQGHTGCSSASSDCPSICRERGNPIRDAATSLTSQGQRARLPRNGPRPPPRAHSSFALSLALSLLLARSGPSPPPSARSPPAAPPHSSVARARCSSARTTAGCASARSRSPRPYCADPSARILLHGFLSLDLAPGPGCSEPFAQTPPSPWTALAESACRDPSA